MAQPLELGQLRDKRLGVLGSGQADGEGGLGQLAGVLLDGGGVGREGLDADVWVGGGAARGFDEVGGSGGGGRVDCESQQGHYEQENGGSSHCHKNYMRVIGKV